jgi:hypothetical protein
MTGLLFNLPLPVVIWAQAVQAGADAWLLLLAVK